MAHRLVDGEDFSTTEVEDASELGQPSCLHAHRRWLVGSIGVVVFCAAGALVMTRGPLAARDNRSSIRMLLESDDTVQATSDQLMRAGVRAGSLRPDERRVVESAVTLAFRDVSDQIRSQFPDLGDQLTIRPERSRMMLDMLKHVNNPRVQRLGLEVARALQSAKTSDRDHQRSAIVRRLQPQIEELRSLYDELVPAALRASREAREESWEALLHPEHVRAMDTYGPEWEGHVQAVAASRQLYGGPVTNSEADFEAPLEQESPADEQAHAHTTEDQPAFQPGFPAERDHASVARSFLSPHTKHILSMVLGGGSVLLKQIKFFISAFRKEYHMPPVLVKLLDLAQVGLRLLNCEFHGLTHGVDTTQMMLCPMQLGASGMHALHAVLSEVGLEHHRPRVHVYHAPPPVEEGQQDHSQGEQTYDKID